MEGTSLLRIIHVQGELQDIVVVKFRGAVPLGHHGKDGSHIVDELRADDTLDIHGFVLHRKGNQHQNLFIIPLRDADAVFLLEVCRDHVGQIHDVFPILRGCKQLVYRDGRFFVVQLIADVQPDEDDQNMDQQIIQRKIVQKQFGLLTGREQLLHNAIDILRGKQLFQRIFRIEKAVGVAHGKAADHFATVLLAATQIELVFLRFDAQVVFFGDLFYLWDDGIQNGAGTDIQGFSFVKSVDTLLTGQ